MTNADERFIPLLPATEWRERRTVNSLYTPVNAVRKCRVAGFFSRLLPPNTALTRRSNVLALFQSYLEQAVAAGQPPKGLEQQFAALLAISPSMWSQVKSSRPIGDKLARQIEHHAAKPEGWLDQAHEVPGVTAAEQAFLNDALAAYRSANARGKKELRRRLLQTPLD